MGERTEKEFARRAMYRPRIDPEQTRESEGRDAYDSETWLPYKLAEPSAHSHCLSCLQPLSFTQLSKL